MTPTRRPLWVRKSYRTPTPGSATSSILMASSDFSGRVSRVLMLAGPSLPERNRPPDPTRRSTADAGEARLAPTGPFLATDPEEDHVAVLNPVVAPLQAKPAGGSKRLHGAGGHQLVH